MTEAEAVVREQFLGAEGFVARLRRGDGIDQESVRLTYEALGVLRSAWADRPHVPKRAVLPMVDVFTGIAATAPLYPEIAPEIRRLAGEMAERVESIFRSPAPRMTEEEAAALVYVHFTGVPSLALDLHHGREPDEETFEEVRAALETLRQAWAG